MLAGFTYLLGEVAALLVLSAGAGLLAGRYLWPARGRGPSVPTVRAAAQGVRATGPIPSPDPSPDPTPDTPRGTPATSPDRSSPGATDPASPAASDSAVTELEHRLRASRAEVVKLQAEALRLKAAVDAVADRKDAEMGRLETAAIEALDSLIASSTKRMTALEEESRLAAAAAREHERDLEEERYRVARLQAALSERDERVALLLQDLSDRNRRIEILSARQTPPPT